MRRNLNRRLELIETRVLARLEEPQALLIQFVSETGAIVDSMQITLDQSRPCSKANRRGAFTPRNKLPIMRHNVLRTCSCSSRWKPQGEQQHRSISFFSDG